MSLLRWNLLPWLCAALMPACASTRQPCDRLEACPGALVCQVGRCAPVDELPVHAEASRQVLDPIDALFVDGATREDTVSELRAASSAGGGALVLLRFEPAWRAKQVDRAYLLLDPVEGAFAVQEPIEVQVSPILGAWSSQRPSPLPGLGQPEARARLSFAPPRRLRIEVTELVRAWAQRGDALHGLALRIYPGDDLGARLDWGTLSGTHPRLDLYLR